ncbi:ABC-2 type transport system permease protein [Actinokineospora alba]|uniref:Transport permease protein n=1 Tax=Actinokineospora alba TaxID=504798 RepID=A0A1H0MW03_9PSEU|nr:ABC transporter permease [Actinokineospora alba]TDP68457.1 ABC-2 type transport system permease protein [Actinokineospora alba]SDH79467.1 ABC-2 type transport system permease protein [Actinokineospora alba]SDO84593.1 ABC-2 type transport system permease protein [Actinokineospora alba]
MNATITLATARRILTQLRHDPRTIAMLLLVPTLLMTLLRFVFNDELVFSRIAPALLGVFPFVIMFLIASVTTLRERTTATLERLMTMPMAKLDLILGYAIAFGGIAVCQVGIATGVSVLWLGLDVAGSVWTLLLIAVLDALLGMALGLLVSAFATSEFQAIQFMPLFVLPQFLLCGLLQPRDSMGWVLNALSDVMPLSYAVDALTQVTRSAEVDLTLLRNLVVVGACVVLAVVLGAATLRRRTP